MLDDDIVLKNCYYWASKLVCRSVDFDELISIGYLVGKPLKDARLLKDWIHFTMLKHITDTLKNMNSHIEFKDSIGIPAIFETHDYKDLYKHIEKAKLSEQEEEVIKCIFFLSKTQKETATYLDITQPTIANYLKRAINKIRTTYGFDAEICFLLHERI